MHPFARKKQTHEGLTSSRKQEKAISKVFSGRCQPNSGGTRSPFKKGDVVTEKVLHEAKTTRKESFSLKWRELNKIYRQAKERNKVPVFHVQFEREGLLSIEENDWVVLPLSEFRRISEYVGFEGCEKL